MKRIYLYLIFALLILSSCNKQDFLNRYPQDAITDANYWKTTSDLELYVNQYYVKFPNLYEMTSSTGTGIYGVDNNSDNMVPAIFNKTLGGTNTVPASGGGWDWSDIRSANIFLANYKSCTSPIADYNTFVGEAMFFKAFFYFNLMRKFGDLPWYSKPLETDSPQLYDPRLARNVVADSIISLLDNAAGRLKEKGKETSFRVYKELALLLKARVALYEGTWEKYHAGTPFGVTGSDPAKYLQLAATTADAVMSTGKFKLYSTGKVNLDYINLFNGNDYSTVSEIMLWAKYDIKLGMGHSAFLASYNGRGTGLSKSILESYLCSDGLPISMSPLYKGDATYLTATQNRDSRLTQTLYMPGDPVRVLNGVVLATFQYPEIDNASSGGINTTGYEIEKGHRPIKNSTADFFDSDQATVLFRYAEALLIFAEAKAELGTIVQGDLDKSINLLRARVGMPNMNLGDINGWSNTKEFPSLSNIINEVRRERKIELAVEGYRFDDLCRWRAHNLITGVKPLGAKFVQASYPTMVVGKNVYVNGDGYIEPYQKSLPAGWGFKPDRDYLSPIPTNELTLNTKLKQNPGW